MPIETIPQQNSFDLLTPPSLTVDLEDPFADANLTPEQQLVVRTEQDQDLQLFQDLQNKAKGLISNDARIIAIKEHGDVVLNQLTNGQRTRAQLKVIRDGINKYKHLIEEMIEKQRLMREEQVRIISGEIQSEINLAKSFNFPNLMTEMQELEKESQRLSQMYIKLTHDEKIIQDHTIPLSKQQMEEFKNNYKSFKMLYESFVKLENQIYGQFVRAEKSVPVLPDLPAEPIKTMLNPEAAGGKRRRNAKSRKGKAKRRSVRKGKGKKSKKNMKK